MAKKPSPIPASAAPPAGASAVTLERFARLHKLLKLIDGRAKPRDALAKALKVDVRGFYRDLDFLRRCGVPIQLGDGRYLLQTPLDRATALLPLPNPVLTFGEAAVLAKGKTAAHRKLQTLLGRITA